MVYEDSATGELIYGDIAGNSKRVIFKAKLDDLPGCSPSKDFSMVFLRFRAKPGQPQTIAVVNTDGTGYREIAKLDGSPRCWPSWSWDNRYLLCAQSHDGTSRLLRISVADGQTRELLSLKSREGRLLSGWPFRGISSATVVCCGSGLANLRHASRRWSAAIGL